jgi:small subunit ribosomal protein S17e
MGKIRPTFIKRTAKEIYEKYSEELSKDFHENRKFLKDKITFQSDRIENRVIGYLTTLVKKGS